MPAKRRSPHFCPVSNDTSGPFDATLYIAVKKIQNIKFLVKILVMVPH